MDHLLTGMPHSTPSGQGMRILVLHADHEGHFKLPEDCHPSDADFARNGDHLILNMPDGSKIVVEDYFLSHAPPDLISSHGILTPELVQSFVHDAGPVRFAEAETVNDASPVGSIKEVIGHATIIHPDGTSETAVTGMPIHEGDIVQTDAKGAVNIVFIDESSFAVSENAKLAIDKYVFDPETHSGDSNFSMLRGLFVYTSGLIGREDPDDVKIHTPVGSIGIRGTVIAGNLSTGEITVVEGAIVLHTNSGQDMTLSHQYETARFHADGSDITHAGTLSASEISARFSSIGGVAAAFYSGLQDSRDGGAHHDQQPLKSGPAENHESSGRSENHGQADQPMPVLADMGNAHSPFSVNSVFSDSNVFSPAAPVAGTAPLQAQAAITNVSTISGAGAVTVSSAVPASASSPAIQAFNTSQTATVQSNPGPVVSAAVFSVAENASSGTIAGTVTATYSDPGRILSYSIAGGTGANLFAINSLTGIVTVTGTLDYETQSLYTLIISASDTIAPTISGTATVTVNISDVNDVAPILANKSFSIDENSAGGTVVGTNAATDPDVTGTLVYSILSGNTGGVFAINSANGTITVANGAVIDYETLNSYTLNVQVSDGLHTANAVYSIAVNDVPEPVSLNNLTTAQGFLISGSANTMEGFSASSVGNVNGDGYDDLVLGNGANNQLSLVHGQASGAGAISSLSPSFTGTANNLSVSFAGDFNGDGIKDIVVGAPGANDANGTPTGTGQAFIMGLNGSIIMKLEGLAASDLTGLSVSGAGDINGDGYDDVLIGAPGSDAAGGNAGRAYLLFGHESSVINPVVDVGALNTGRVIGSDASSNPSDLTISGNYAYVLSSSLDTLSVYDISDPTSPLNIGQISSGDITVATSGGVTDGLDGGTAMAVSGNYLFASGSASGRLTVIDISNPSAPVYSASILTGIQNINSLAYKGNLLIASSASTDSVSLIDITNPLSPLVKSTYTGTLSDPDSIGFSADGSVAYIGSSGNNRIEVVDVSNPVSPATITVVTHAGMTGISDIAVSGNLMYVTAATSGTLFIYDISNHNAPQLAGIFTDSSLTGATGLSIHDTMAYISAGNAVVTLDVYDPAHISKVNLYASAFIGGAMDLATDGHGLVHVIGATVGTYAVLETHTDGIAINGLSAQAQAGATVSGIGDFNNDGFADFAIASPNGGNGRIDIVFGSSNLSQVTLGADTMSIVNIAGGISDTGIPMRYAGDMNGDGIADIMFASSAANAGNGIAYVVYGSSAYQAGSQTDIASGLSGTNGYMISTGSSAIHGIGAVGDYNGDGYDDAVVILKNAGSYTADVYVVYGHNAAAADGILTLAELNTSANAYHLTYTIPANITNPDTFSFVVSAAGDMNGDGYADFMIGLSGLDTNTAIDSSGDLNPSNDRDGSSIFVYGQNTGTGNAVTDNSVNDANATVNTIAASASSQSLIGSVAANTLTDSGLIGISMHGGGGNDTLLINNADFRALDGGAGDNDILKFMQASGTLDFRNVHAETVGRVETVDMGSTGQTLYLTLDNVFALMNASDTGDLYISASGGMSNTLVLDNQRAGSMTSADAAQIGEMIGSGHVTSQTSTYAFDLGGHSLVIDKALIDGGHVNVA